MKISDRNTALHFLMDDDPVEILVKSADQVVRGANWFFHDDFVRMRPLFRQRIQYISQPFLKAYIKGHEKLSKVFIDEPVTQSGTLIIPLEGGLDTTFYSLSGKMIGDHKWALNCTIITFSSIRNFDRPVLVTLIHHTENARLTYDEADLPGDNLSAESTIGFFLGMVIFMRFCELETKIIPAGNRAAHVSQKYVNTTKQPIEILDSTWFTTIVRSEGFTVGGETGGFFRLQPCGPGLSQKKLVWIFPFEKEGYTRKAKMLREGK